MNELKPLRSGRMPVCALLALGVMLIELAAVPIWSQIIPANRRTTWQGNVGVPGGIPNRGTIYTTVPAGASLATVQTAINNCPSDQVVMLSAGAYSFGGVLNLNKNNVTLRGAGPGATTISFTGGGYLYIGNSAWYAEWGSPQAARHKNWTGGLSQGSTTIQVDSTVGLAVGMLLFMDQLNGANVDVVGACNGPVGGLYSSMARPGVGSDRWQSQLNRVTAIHGNTLTLSEPVYMPNYSAGLSPQVWSFGAQPGATLSGVENLTIIGSGSGATNIYFQNAYACWAKNVVCKNARYGINFAAALRCEMRQSRSEGAAGFLDNYVVQTFASSGLWLEDNITSDGAWVLQGLSGSAISYNYLTKTTGSPGWMQGGFVTHGSHPTMNLFEGNYAPGLWLQNCWGSSEYTTALRNRFVGVDEDTSHSITDDIQAVQVGYWQRYTNIVGNVLGTSGVNNWYDDGSASYTCHSRGRVYAIGISSGGCSTTYDPTTRSSMVRAWNWDSASSGDGIPDKAAFAISDIPSSYLYSAKPAFFGNLAWPPYGPANPSAKQKTLIPAGYRFVNGTAPPVGSGDVTAPSVPADAVATAVGAAQVNVNWTASTDNVGVAGYRLERSQGAGSSAYTQVAAPSGTSFSDTGLTASTVYNYRLRAVDAAGNSSGYSTVGTATTTASIPDATDPSVPTNPAAAVVSAVQVNLNWTASTDNVGVTGYRVERSQGAGSTAYTQVATPAGTSFNDAGLTGSTDYNYRVRAVDAAGNMSGYSAVVPVTTSTPDAMAPSVPTNPIATVVSAAQIILSWTASTDNVAVTGYRVERSQGANSTAYTQVATPAGTSFNDAGLTGSTVYNYRVRAVDAVGNISGYSSVVVVTTDSLSLVGLVASYGFEESFGTAVSDSSGNGNAGTITTATRVPGKFGSALLFNGTDSVVSIGSPQVVGISASMTIEAWVKPAMVGNRWLPVLGKAYNGSELSYVLQGVTTRNGVPGIYIAQSPSNLYGSTPLSTTEWSHLAMTADGNTVCLYMNGLLVASQAQTGTPSASNAPLTIGSDGLFQSFWNGVIDEVRIYNRALNSSEIQRDLNTPVGFQVFSRPQNNRIIAQ